VRAIAQLLGVGIDNARLTAAQQRERRMAAESAVTLGTVLESVGSGVCVVDLDGTLRLANKALQDLFGFQGRSTGLTQEEVFANATARPRDFDAFMARLRELMADPAQVDESEWELEAVGSATQIVQRHSAPMRNLVGEVVGRVEVYTDVTEGRRLYTQLLNSEKLRAIGEMASGIAHDFNNLLASIVGQTELLHSEELPPTARQAIATVRQAALDGARMVRSLQGHARPRAAQTPSAAADLNETVQLAAEMARPRWAGAALRGGAAIDLQLTLAETARVAIHPAELREVLLNLLFNAADAMPDGGHIAVATRHSRQPGMAFAEVEVRDTGHGMPEAVRARVFEPFFSTKGPKGSGLGLAVAYSIIQRHGGAISVESDIGRGTTFVIRLPLAPSASSAARLTPGSATGQPPGGSAGAGVRAAESSAQARGSATPAGSATPRSGSPSDHTPSEGAPAPGNRTTSLRPSRPAEAAEVTPLSGSSSSQSSLERAPSEGAPEPSHGASSVAAAGPVTPARLRPPSDAPHPAALQGARALVVDDEPGLVAVVRQLMERAGALVQTAHGGAAALDALRQPDAAFDVVITDLDMPEVDGWAVAAEVEAQSPGCPVVMLTGWAGEIAPEDFKRRGIDVLLAKPCSRAELEAAVAQLLAPKPGPADQLDILLVDDEPAFASSVRDLLALQGHRVVLVESAEAALAAAAERPFDVVLTDYSLGDMTGAQLAEQLGHPFVVLVTGYATEVDDPALLTSGVHAVLPKPCRGDDLKAVLARVPRQ
jgi:signal transduction histidine kinase/DNA-binding response OmpR family regulator